MHDDSTERPSISAPCVCTPDRSVESHRKDTQGTRGSLGGAFCSLEYVFAFEVAFELENSDDG